MRAATNKNVDAGMIHDCERSKRLAILTQHSLFPLPQKLLLPLVQREVACPRSSSSNSSKRTQKFFRIYLPDPNRPQPRCSLHLRRLLYAARLRECIFASYGKSETPPQTDVESGKVVVLGTK